MVAAACALRAKNRLWLSREVVSWTAAALSAMLSSPAASAPNDVTLLTVLSPCAGAPFSLLARTLALSLHALAIKLFPSHLLLCTCLARFYLASRLPHLALQLFGSMPVRSVVTYNTMITGLMRNGLVAPARKVFDGMPARDKVSWTALIDGCVKNGHHDEAIDCFHAMLLNGVEPDYVTLIAVISACAEVPAAALGCSVGTDDGAASRTQVLQLQIHHSGTPACFFNCTEGAYALLQSYKIKNKMHH